MGANWSGPSCGQYADFDNCSVISNSSSNYWIIGGVRYGEFSPDPDIAGVGIFYAFFVVSALALVVSLGYLLLGLSKRFQRSEKAKERIPKRVGWPDIIEGIILSCSDQQLFTAGAYAITLRCFRGCTISTYHYNIVGNMLLISCATHLMSVMVVAHYWKNILMTVVRSALITGVYVITAVILSNEGSGGDYPMDIPPANATNSLLLLKAMCFQDGRAPLLGTLKDTFQDPESFFKEAIGKSSPGNNRIFGWNFFILMVLWYGLAIIADFLRLWIRRRDKAREREQEHIERRGWLFWVLWIYQFAGTVLSMAAILNSFLYIKRLRSWMSASGWVQLNEQGENEENNATTFGQLVPLLLTLLTVLFFIGMMGDKWSEHRHRDDELPIAPLHFAGNSPYNSESLSDRKDSRLVQYTSVPPSPRYETEGYQFRPQQQFP